MESNSLCQRCQMKPITFICNNCKPFTSFCSQCDTAVHTLPFRMNHHRKALQIPKELNNSILISSSPQPLNIPVKDLIHNDKSTSKEISIETYNNLKEIENSKNLYIENKQLKRELYNLKHMKKEQDDLKDDAETFYETKLTQMYNETNLLRKENIQLNQDLDEKTNIVIQLQKQIEQMNIVLKEKNKKIETCEGKYGDMEGFFKFKFEEMQKEKDYLIKQLQLCERNIENQSLNYKSKDKNNHNTFQLPIKDNKTNNPHIAYEYHH